jgi:hypothetical protein
MAVHLTCFKHMKNMPTGPLPAGVLGAGLPVAQVGDIDTAEVIEFDIAAGEALIPAGTLAIAMRETEGTPFRYAIGASGVTVPAAPGAHRWTAQDGRMVVGAAGGQYIKTAAA